jgi:hypothetical protein
VVAQFEPPSPVSISSSGKSARVGRVRDVIHSASVSPSQASPEFILKADLYGTALVLKGEPRLERQGVAAAYIETPSRNLAGPDPAGTARRDRPFDKLTAGRRNEVLACAAIVPVAGGTFEMHRRR